MWVCNEIWPYDLSIIVISWSAFCVSNLVWRQDGLGG